MKINRFSIGHLKQDLPVIPRESNEGRVESYRVANRELVTVFDAQGRKILFFEFADEKCVSREAIRYRKDGSILIVARRDIDGDGRIDVRSRTLKKEGRTLSIHSEVRPIGSDRFERVPITFMGK